MGHAWLNEIASHSALTDASQAYEHFDLAIQAAQDFLARETSTDANQVPAEEEGVRRGMAVLQDLLLSLRSLAERRLNFDFDMASATTLDAQIQRVFDQVVQQAQQVQSEQSPALTLELRRLRSLHAMLIVLCVVLSIFIWMALRRYERQLQEETLALRQSEECYRDVTQDTQLLVCRHSPSGELLFVNKSYCDYFQMSPEQLIGFSFLNLLPKSERPRVIENLASMTVDAPTQSYEQRMIDAKGDVRWHRWSNHTLFDSDGMAEVVQAVGEDITERKFVELALIASEERMELAIRGADLGTWDWNVATGHAIYNDRWASMLGFELEEIDSDLQAWEELMHPDDLAVAWASIKNHLEGHSDYFEVEFRMRHKDGSWIWILDRGRAISRDDHGKALRACGTHLDISERKRAELQAARFSLVLEDSLSEVYFFDAENLHFLEVSHGACVNLGYSIEELRGMTPLDIKPGFDSEQWASLVSPLYDGSLEIIHFLTNHQRKDGSLYPVELNLQLMQTEEPTFVALARDITESQRAEAERLSLERQIQHAQKLESLGVLAGGIAHDFNNILMAILGNAALALAELPPISPLRDKIEAIENASKRAAALAKQMLAYSGKGRFVVEPVDARQLLEEMAHLLEVSISKKVVLKYNVGENVPTFIGDVTQIRQVIMNLITNASEAIGDRSGVITLSTGAVDCDRGYLDGINQSLYGGMKQTLPEGIYTYFEVADTGVGMDADTIQKIFDPFFTTKFTGRGLGLSAVLGIVRGHCGALIIDSQAGRGTTFRVLFPANDRSVGLRAQNQQSRFDVTWRGQGTVLLADDEEVVCAVGKQMLERLGFRVLTAADGRIAVDLFAEHLDEVDCVLLDLTMPHVDGEEAFRKMRRLKHDIPVLLCSGYNEQDATARFAGKGLTGFVQKPYSLATLHAKLVKILPAAE